MSDSGQNARTSPKSAASGSSQAQQARTPPRRPPARPPPGSLQASPESQPAFSPGLSFSEGETISPAASTRSAQELGDLSPFGRTPGPSSTPGAGQAALRPDDSELQQSSFASTGGYLPSTRDAVEHSESAQKVASSKASPGGVGELGSSASEATASRSQGARAHQPEPAAGEESAGFFCSVKGEQAYGPAGDPSDIQAALDVTAALELAVLEKLSSLETRGPEEAPYSIEDMMDLARWLEPKLLPAARPRLFRWMLHGTSTNSDSGIPNGPTRNVKLALAGAWTLCTVLGFILLAVMTGVMLDTFKHIEVQPSGLLGLPGGDFHQAGVAEAVNLHGLLEYPVLPTEDLRRAQDVVFTHEGSFHFYRVAAIEQTKGGGVRIAAEDGTHLLVRDGLVTFARPWSSKEILPQNAEGAQGATMATAGAFKTIMSDQPFS